MSGNKPKEGKILIENGQVVDKLSTDATKTTVIKTKDDYTVSYDSKGELVATKAEEGSTSTLCTYVEEAGTAPKTVGAKYTCTLGGESKTFYVLEVGTTPVSDSNLESDEFALIMDSNLTNDTFHWCADTTATNNACEPYYPTYLEENADWGVEVTVPTYNQLNALNGLPTWITSPGKNFWTQTKVGDLDVYTVQSSMLIELPIDMPGFGIRPVIIIKDGELN